MQERAEADLRFRALVENAPFPMIVANLTDNSVLFANNLACQMVDLPMEAFIGQKTPDFWVRPEERAGFIQAALQAGAVYNYEAELKTGPGKPFWSLISGRISHYGEHRAIIVTINDISQHKAASEALRVSEERLQAILKASPDGILLLDLNGRVQYASDHALACIGMDTMEEARRHDVRDFVLASEHGHLGRTIAALIRGRAVGTESFHSLRLDGSKVWIEANGTLLHNPLGEPDGLMFVIRDVTERVMQEEELRLARQALEESNHKLQQAMGELEQAALTDALTGIWNRRYFEQRLGIETGQSMRYGTPLSLLIFDIDHFKRINDRFGHATGDKILVELTSATRGRIRSGDVFARWGGEEFVILVPNCGLEEARVLAEKLRVGIQDHLFPEVGGITISLGLAKFHAGDTMDRLFLRADQALYRAKTGGRNRVEADTGKVDDQLERTR